jgi:hypothetical protein
MAYIYTMVEEYDSALKQLDYLLSVPGAGGWSIPLLKIDPMWDPLRNHASFKKVKQKYSPKNN